MKRNINVSMIRVPDKREQKEEESVCFTVQVEASNFLKEVQQAYTSNEVIKYIREGYSVCCMQREYK